ncbi:MAG: DnaJ domain-containing protein [Bacteroidetes bacterium]|nr:DnaJ domain-containing protein [Bacteroidota bacterium]
MVNYFETFGLPVSFHPPQDLVRKKYYELSRKHHPDRFAQEPKDEAINALQMSALINDGYKILKDAEATVEYVLRLEGVLETDEKYSLPQSFLMEVMDLNEAVSEYEMLRTEESKQMSLVTLEEQNTALKNKMDHLLNSYDAGNKTSESLAQIKDCFFRKKYLLRIQKRITTFASP